MGQQESSEKRKLFYLVLESCFIFGAEWTEWGRWNKLSFTYSFALRITCTLNHHQWIIVSFLWLSVLLTVWKGSAENATVNSPKGKESSQFSTGGKIIAYVSPVDGPEKLEQVPHIQVSRLITLHVCIKHIEYHHRQMSAMTYYKFGCWVSVPV